MCAETDLGGEAPSYADAAREAGMGVVQFKAFLHRTRVRFREIGRGGMGTVYKARHRGLGRTVAVKFLPESLAAQPEFQARFEREARALAMLNHPNIVAVHDFGREEGQSYIVMEYVEGGSLAGSAPDPRMDLYSLGGGAGSGRDGGRPAARRDDVGEGDRGDVDGWVG